MKTRENNQEERLKNALKGLEDPFQVPSGYFDDLPEKIKLQIDAMPSMENQSSINPFTVPENYFASLPDSVSQRITSRKPGFINWLSSLQRPRIAIPIAFATILIFGGIYFYKQQHICNLPDQEITSEDLRNSTYLQTIDEDLFVEMIPDQKINTSDDSIEKYLLDNDIDISQIENEL